MGYDRLDRINEEVRKALDQIIRGELNDPRIGGTFSFPSAEVTRDLKYCKVRVSILEEERRADFMKALKSARGYIRRALGRQVELRNTPELLFELDQNMEYAAHIQAILKADEARGEASGDERNQ